ncbi:MAG: sigma 54-interacting transcriptional regulator [Nitrospirae bacterium YQR-1]
MKNDYDLKRALVQNEMGESETMVRISGNLLTASESDATLIIEGETGTGKRYTAKLVHRLSKRASQPFVTVDLSLIPEPLVESELFGYEEGAFTGVDNTKRGFFQAANHGTLLLSELQTLSRELQKKLLSVIKSGKITPPGTKQHMEFDIRFIVSANKSLDEIVKQDSFSGDLYKKLNESMIKIPALRNHKEDIAFFAKKFLDEISAEVGKQIYGFSEDAITMMGFHDWPDNLRELKTVIRNAVLMSKTNIIDIADLAFLRAYVKGYRPSATGRHIEKIHRTLKDVSNKAAEYIEKETICHVLNITSGNKKKAASLLQVDYKTLFNKIGEYNVVYPKEPLTLRSPRLDTRSRRAIRL